MAFIFSLDERTLNGLVYSAGALDVRDSFFDTPGIYGQLVENQWAYGETTYDFLGGVDNDFYMLGELAPGRYEVDVDDYTWDIFNPDIGSVLGFNLYNGSGALVDSKVGTFSNISFDVSSTSSYYVSILGSFTDAQYMVKYVYTPTVNYPAVFWNPTFTGTLEVGSNLSANVQYSDLNGVSNSVFVVSWFADGDLINTLNKLEPLQITSDQANKTITFTISFIDDAGNLETSPQYTVGTVPEVASEPEGTSAIPNTERSEFNYADFELYLNQNNFDIDKIKYLSDDPISKWGGSLGTAPTLSFYINENQPLDYHSSYYDASTEEWDDVFSSLDSYSATDAALYSLGFSPTEKQEIIEALNDWSLITGINFQEETVYDKSNPSDIIITKLDFAEWYNVHPSALFQGEAWANFPSDGDYTAGDIFLNDNLHLPFKHVISHEIGHALGLHHPHHGNVVMGDGQGPVYTDDMPNYLSVMSYDEGFDFVPQTPMEYDLLSMNALYGGSQANSGNSTHIFNVEDFSQANSYGYRVREMLHDVSGYDEVILQSTSITNTDPGVYFDLRSGNFSNLISIDPIIYEADKWEFGSIYISEATQIEKLVTTAGHDSVTSLVDWQTDIHLGDGNDLLLTSGQGSQLYGDSGSDTVYLLSDNFDNFAIDPDSQNPSYAKVLNDNELYCEVSDFEIITLFNTATQSGNTLAWEQFLETYLPPAPNTLPTLSTTSSITTDEDTPSSPIAFSATDADGDPLTFTFSTPNNGTVIDNGNGTFTYTPSINYNGTDNFTLTVNDGREDVTETITVVVEPVNDDPVLTTSNTIAIDEDTPSSAIAFSATDVDGDALTYTFSTSTKGTITRDDANGTYVYTPNADVNGSDSFTIAVNDGAATVTETVNVAITAVNDDPVLTTSNTISVNEGTASTAITFSATDVDGDVLTYTFSTSTKGTITRDDANGTYVYTPNTNANGSDSFTISVTDGTVTVTETINVSIFNLVEGTSSDDTLSGSSGSDNIIGLSGHDVITGGLGDDWLSGGLGNDIFHFASSGDGHDTIYAFEHDVDQIKFDGVSYVVGDPDNYAGITETTNGNGDTVIQYGGSSSITLTEAVASSPFELVEIPSQRYGDIFTFGLKLKDDPSTTNLDTQIVSEFNDIDIEIGWTSGEFSYWGGYRYGQNDIYDTANSGAGLNLASSNLSPGNPNATTLNLTYSEASNLAISENDYLATFMLERSDTSSAQNNSITLKTSQGKVLDATSQQLVSLPNSQTPRSYEFNFANDTVAIQLGTFRGNAAPNSVVFVSNDSVSDGLALRVIEKIGDLVRYEIILNISDATFKGGEAFASHHKIKVKDAIILDNTIALKSDLANAEGAELTSNGYLAKVFLDQVDKTASVSQLSTEQDEQNAFLNDIILPNDANPITETNFDTSSTLEFRASNLALPSSVGFGTDYNGSNGSYVLAEFLAYGATISFESGRSNNFSNLVLGNEINISREIDDQSVAHSGVWSETVRDSAIISVIGDGYHLDLGNSSDVVDAGDALGVLRAIIDAAQNSPENRTFTTKHYIAGDFNSDGRLSAADAYEILSYSIFGNTQGTVFPQWVYVSDLVSNTSTFSDIHYEEPIGITTDNLGSLDITAILKGDLSFSYSDTNFQGNLVEGLIADFESALIL